MKSNCAICIPKMLSHTYVTLPSDHIPPTTIQVQDKAKAFLVVWDSMIQQDSKSNKICQTKLYIIRSGPMKTRLNPKAARWGILSKHKVLSDIRQHAAFSPLICGFKFHPELVLALTNHQIDS